MLQAIGVTPGPEGDRIYGNAVSPCPLELRVQEPCKLFFGTQVSLPTAIFLGFYSIIYRLNTFIKLLDESNRIFTF